MGDVLQQIYAAKAALLKEERAREPYGVLRDRALSRIGERRGFLAAMRDSVGWAIVAEIKRASPSAGPIARNVDPAATARIYESAGADAISVVTERDHFSGELAYLEDVRRVTTRPLLRKDFMWTRYQVAQSAAHGADCVLLIAGAMGDATLRECMDEARAYALDVLVEVHDEVELDRAIAVGAELIGVNNRDLRTFLTNLSVGERLLPNVPEHVFAVSESGMRDRSDVARLRAAGARGFLIGEALMRAKEPAGLLKSLRWSATPAARGRISAV
jgi:indole-3-glycerol phosphate synthase